VKATPPAWWVWVRRFGPIALVALAVVLLFASGAGRSLSLQDLREHRQWLAALVSRHPLISLAAYLGLYALAVGLSLPLALIFTLAGGLLFGPWIGGAASAIGCTCGSTLIFLICRTAVGGGLRGKAGSMIDKIKRGLQGDAFAYIVALRLMPIAPLWLVNLALGFTPVPLRTYVAATFIGTVPTSLIFASLGASLNRVFASGAPLGPGDFVRPQIILPLAGLGLLALAPMAVRRLRQGRKA